MNVRRRGRQAGERVVVPEGNTVHETYHSSFHVGLVGIHEDGHDAKRRARERAGIGGEIDK